ncbi:hypothetical protein [Enterovibrio coralii]|uniref:DUF304 domain-containing protein n=1 Tax=Enterovibrio coralii TaxID=294935 RepID=A0A135IDD9_9GAMM|nr:hypothetical protein [Enterovibrio coralii]KXF83425.1 hypothetical protein ATN88_07205 [Enterovibrio coralii]
MRAAQNAHAGDVTLQLGGGGTLRVFGCVFLTASVFLALQSSIDSPDAVLAWATCTAFGWHMVFIKHRIIIRRLNGTLVRQISSVYPVYKFEANIDAIRGFAVSRALIGRDRYGRKVFELSVLFDSGKRERLLAGNKEKLIRQGEKIAALCDKPFHVEDE